MNSARPEDIKNRLLVARLPTMPQILIKLIELCQSDETGVVELAKLISNDAGMTSRVLRVANSAAYQRSGRQLGLPQALTTLGSDLVKSLLISESVFQTFSGFPHTGSTDLRPFWKHSLTAAVLARDLAKATRYPQVEEAYLAGLLHDVGRLALLAVAPDIYSTTFQNADDDYLCAAEQQDMHITHTEAGAWLIERWEMDSFLADAVLYHHEAPARVMSAHPLIRLVHLSHLLSEHQPGTRLPAGIGAVCELSDAAVLEIHQGCEAQVMLAAEQLAIDLAGLDETQALAPVMANPMQQRLTEEIRNRTLAAELGQVFARQNDGTQLLDSVRQNARILFDLDDSALFLVSGNGRSLMAVSVGEQRQRLANFSVSLAGGGIADAVTKKNLAFLERGRSSLNLAEEQLLRAFNTPCLLCLPLVADGRSLGLLIAGIESWRVTQLQSQEKFLLAFGTQAANAMAAATKGRAEIEQRIATLQEEHLKSSRKIVHEVNNPLSIIKNYLGVLDDKLARKEPLGSELTILNEEIDRVGSIIKEFARVAPPAPDATININQVVSDIVRLFRESRFLPPTVQISALLPEEPSEISCSTGIVKQIFVNLIKNSVEALSKGGRIEIVNNGITLRGGAEYFSLLVKDNGPGMPNDVMAKLFSPVRSTKAGDNRGLGLSIVHGLVQKLQGSISCKSSELGTAFEILLPAKRAKSLI
ncbi:HDOD domain-containing protein [Rhodoferax sp.]|uniref:HDOD domain-containing protein n=1 Tax=Rhodoferax sp. TaxID=50421 RepID=UPI00284B62C2|nr:HDOD domain-containing protein [Rhodoferax sp.]MDR3368394.1 HDOD domain-containing protein [Rhodoferax sp.]